jgi:chromosome segregation ATPase
MEIMLVFLSTAIGTVAGVIVAAVMMQRKIRVAGASTDIALKTQLQNTEWALSSAGRDVEDLRKLLEVRDQATQQAREELEKTQQQLAALLAGTEKEAAARAEAEQRAQNLEAQLAGLKSSSDEEAVRHIAALEAEAAESRRQVEELTAQLAEQRRAGDEESGRIVALQAEAAETRRQFEESARQASAFEAEAANSRHQVEELNARLASLADEYTARQRSTEEEIDRQVSALEAEVVNSRRQIADLSAQLADHQRTGEEAEALLSAERASVRQLAAQVEQLSADRTSLEAQLQKERRSAAEGMQLLQLVQSKLSGAPQNGGNGNGNAAHLVEAV